MMYPFMTLDDDTEIVHSDMLPDGRVKVYIERPDEKYGSVTLLAIFQIIRGKIFISSPRTILTAFKR